MKNFRYEERMELYERLSAERGMTVEELFLLYEGQTIKEYERRWRKKEQEKATEEFNKRKSKYCFKTPRRKRTSK